MKQDIFVIVSPYLNTVLYYASNINFNFDVNEARFFGKEAEARRHLNRLQTIDRNMIERIDIDPDTLAIQKINLEVQDYLFFTA